MRVLSHESEGRKLEANQESMDPDCRCPRRGACRWRLWQKESGLRPSDVSAATVPGAYCLVDRQSQHHSSGPGEHVDVEDRLRHRRHHRSTRSEEHTSELQSPCNLVCRLLLEKKNKKR